MTTHMNHPYHLVEKSPWPIIGSFSVCFLLTGFAKWFHTYSFTLVFLSFITLILCSYQWWRDINRESTLQGFHTMKVTTGLRYGMILFILSEVLFFFSFFWAFFHSSLNTTVEIGLTWPPTGVEVFNPFKIPLLNTIILLVSGVSVTWAHNTLLQGLHNQSIQSLFITIFLGVYFTFLQIFEYFEASFSISDSIYGTVFFVATGFHGLHVIIGSLFLSVNLFRLFMGHFSTYHHFGLEAAIWYWHFVDVVWLFLFVFIYWWGS
uniref:Cytochrome c oxidase subunit 3 n=1 Tax=Metacrangonyx longicaudus TaxID=1199243 RepID=K7ZW07_9CRUS|nr:cytochrome c oxidase subunit III [Metacrangonyx longicaudus]CCI69451.1 cytochrome oxidase subunit 3 [Metacrangonyx longicaudus]